ncbi:MAG TPA: type II toxin-antitoxin system VapC family toxin [Longimicrobiales bacterium]|nr:type II toxin-antitoxin system VapC family toxin [Longimicrobiales bacterium]
MELVVGASVTLAWAFEDERTGLAMSVLDALDGSEAVAASIWPLEIVNGLVVAERRGRITSQDASRFASLLLQLPIVVDPVERRRPFETTRQLARDHQLSAYDASYLELAIRLGVPLATLDHRLADAAGQAGVSLFAS